MICLKIKKETTESGTTAPNSLDARCETLTITTIPWYGPRKLFFTKKLLQAVRKEKQSKSQINHCPLSGLKLQER